MRKLASITVAAAGLFLVLGAAHAGTPAEGQSKKPRAPRGVITLETVTIKGRLQQPIAAIDVTRLRPKLTLSELRQPFVDRIGKAVYGEPF
jgi:hypothetical protein